MIVLRRARTSCGVRGVTYANVDTMKFGAAHGARGSLIVSVVVTCDLRALPIPTRGDTTLKLSTIITWWDAGAIIPERQGLTRWTRPRP
jgi:hypothetical protein